MPISRIPTTGHFVRAAHRVSIFSDSMILAFLVA
jgi:hypothetical protein